MNRRHGDRPDETADPAPRRAVEDSDWLLGEDVSESVLGTEPTGRSEVWRRRAALGLIWLGRVLLVAWLLGIATARLSPGVWMAAPLEDGLPLHPTSRLNILLLVARWRSSLAPPVGLEPTTLRLTVECSAN